MLIHHCIFWMPDWGVSEYRLAFASYLNPIVHSQGFVRGFLQGIPNGRSQISQFRLEVRRSCSVSQWAHARMTSGSQGLLLLLSDLIIGLGAR